VIRATFLAVIVCAAAAAQPKPRGWKPSFERLSRCVASLPAEHRGLLQPLLAELNRGLNGEFLKTSVEKPPVPPAYVDSLDRNAELCEYALARVARGDVLGMLNDLAKDIQVKTQDCRDNGWYRNVPVEVKTLKDGAPSPGWEIFYVWLPGKNLPSLQKVRFKSLSPSTEMLPPGLYAFQAKKKDVLSEETRIAVVSRGNVRCEIPVP
jgi:hypothetical protein